MLIKTVWSIYQFFLFFLFVKLLNEFFYEKQQLNYHSLSLLYFCGQQGNIFTEYSTYDPTLRSHEKTPKFVQKFKKALQVGEKAD